MIEQTIVDIMQMSPRMLLFLVILLVVLFIVSLALQIRLTRLKMEVLDIQKIIIKTEAGIQEQVEDQESILKRIASVKVFDKFYQKKEAFADPFNEAWEGEPDNRRKKTA